MTPEEQRIAIAEACGWEARHDHLKWTWLRPDGRAFNGELPDYLNDLNAMHEAEKVLREMQTMTYLDRLGDIVSQGMGEGSYGEIWNILHATAAQRAEAFLRTLHLWKE
jgi:hypothetical protein